eukprot:GGOE01055929.1.p1 GENE.GGOE01055929.1~~GGOE01055929.1.p1  ORF type:complete len:994 (-),score=275.65 GGOE01055929.1:1173-3797(-)
MNEVVNTFASLMGSVIKDFKGVATGYAAELRSALAAKASTTLQQMITGRITNLKRFQMSLDLNTLNFSRVPWDPIGMDDCTMLGVLCATAVEMATTLPVIVTLATGRTYSCMAGIEASISTISFNGSQYTEQLQKWAPDNTSALVTRQRCLSGSPASIVTVGQNCSRTQGCSCGQDQRCAVWYTAHAADVSPSLAKFDVFVSTSGDLAISISLSLFRSSGTNSSLIGVAANNFAFAAINRYLAALVTTNTTLLAYLLNDTALSAMGNTGVKCGTNETAPGDPSLPTWSSLRSCDPGLRALARWLFQNRSSVQSTVSLQINDTLWDIFPGNINILSYFLIIGSPLSVINAAVDASDARADSQLITVRAEQLSRVAASGDATKKYMKGVGAENINASQAMEVSFLMQMKDLENTSIAALISSQHRSTAQVQELMESETSQINSLTSKHLDAMAVATGWTIGVVFAILLVVLLCSAWGTVYVTRDLTDIIGCMEDVAEMRVENLAVPRRSHVTEVARIHFAFQVLVQRLAEYKSYIPAGVFEQMRKHEEEKGDHPEGSDGDADWASSADLGSQQIVAALPGAIHVQRMSSNGSRSSVSTSPKNASRHRAAVLSFYVFDFTEVLLQMAPPFAKKLLSQYITHVHEAACQNRGNIDFVAGDQILVTFNAHFACADPAGAAVAAAIEMRRLLWSVTREQLKLQIGISFGPVLSGSVGYSKFRSMATLGSPAKIASMVSQMSGFESGTVLIDTSMEERMKYVYDLHPVALVHFPQLKALSTTVLSRRVFQVQASKNLQEDEWLYQVDKMSCSHTDWHEAFNGLVAATTIEEGRGHLEKFLKGNPQDAVALRLRDRLAAWTPTSGLPLWDRAEHIAWETLGA